MFYRQKIYWLTKRKNVKSRESLEILHINYFPITAAEKSKSRKRKKRDAESEMKQKNSNDKNSRLYFYRKAQSNFDTTDYVWHITYDDKHRPDTLKKLENDFRNLIKRINRYRKGLKSEIGNLRYMAVIEDGTGTTAKLHIHMLVDGDIDRDILEDFWKKGNSNIDRLKNTDEGIKDLCNYMNKDPKGKKRWKQSKGNLVEPKVTVNDCRFSKRQMEKMAKNHPSREEFQKMYPGYILTDYSIKIDKDYGTVYMNIEMRRYIKNDVNSKEKDEKKKRKQSRKRE